LGLLEGKMILKSFNRAAFLLGVLILLSTGSCSGHANVATLTPLATSTSGPSNTPTLVPTSAPTETPTEILTPPPDIGSEWVSPVDNMVMVYVPEGDFTMGNDAYDDEKPAHIVHLSTFWIDLTEVTNAMYKLCVQAKVCAAPTSSASYSYTSYYDNPQFVDYPVIFVSWVDARDYCSWAGERLPTEAEWEKAARGTDGRLYPWGNEAPNCSSANFTTNGRTCVGDPARVGSYPGSASPFGVLDMAGNVMEWVHDTYDPSYYSRSPQNDPQGSDKSDYRVVRGGSWYTTDKALRLTNRNYENPYNTYDTLGFRCVRSITP
jgi:eukaryotic-like serine/threonine-protein kinase